MTTVPGDPCPDGACCRLGSDAEVFLVGYFERRCTRVSRHRLEKEAW